MSQAISESFSSPYLQTVADDPAGYSDLVDDNSAREVTVLSTDEILTQSGLAILGQTQQRPSLVLTLLQC
jgi:flagellin-like hook-associated protein FlgL